MSGSGRERARFWSCPLTYPRGRSASHAQKLPQPPNQPSNPETPSSLPLPGDMETLAQEDKPPEAPRAVFHAGFRFNGARRPPFSKDWQAAERRGADPHSTQTMSNATLPAASRWRASAVMNGTERPEALRKARAEAT